MTGGTEQYPFIEVVPAVGAASRMPYVPLTLSLGPQSIQVTGLLDTGAAVNVLP